MTAGSDYSVRGPEASAGIRGVIGVSDRHTDRRGRRADNGKGKKKDPGKKTRAPSGDADAPPDDTQEPADDGHTVDHLA